MSWLFSQVLVEEYLGESCSDGEPSVQSNGSHTQLAYLSQDKMTAFSRLSRYGMTFKPLTESRGEELLTLYLAGFHAKTSVAQGKEPGLTENEAECGEKWRGSFAKWNPDSYSWKTHQCSLAGDLDEFSETFPQWGLMLRGECWEQRTLEQTIRGIGYGLSPNGVNTFHTPNTTGLDGGSNGRKALKKKMEMIGTPTASMSERSEKFAKGRLPTPAEYVQKYPTPTCHNSKEGAFPSEYKRNTPSLAIYAGGKLNPTWVEWLMGWTLGWTDLKPLETDKYHYARQQHGKY
jgi:hypothetical protein